MPANLSDLRYGRVVEAVFTDHNGIQKRRTALILTPTADISPHQPLVLMAITTTFPDPPPPGFIPLPWNNDPRRVSTGLARRSAAMVEWIQVIDATDILGVSGDVPAKYMNRIQHAMQNP